MRELQEPVDLRELKVNQVQEALGVKDSTLQEVQPTSEQATELHETTRLELQNLQEQQDTT